MATKSTRSAPPRPKAQRLQALARAGARAEASATVHACRPARHPACRSRRRWSASTGPRPPGRSASGQRRRSALARAASSCGPAARQPTPATRPAAGSSRTSGATPASELRGLSVGRNQLSASGSPCTRRPAAAATSSSSGPSPVDVGDSQLAPVELRTAVRTASRSRGRDQVPLGPRCQRCSAPSGFRT